MYQTMHLLDVNGLTDTKTRFLVSKKKKCLGCKRYVKAIILHLNDGYHSEACFVKNMGE